jgi:hypothetical protein
MVKIVKRSVLRVTRTAAVALAVVGINSASTLALPAVPPLKSQAPAQAAPIPAAPAQPAPGPAPAPAPRPSTSSLIDAFANGKLIIEARYRYEQVDQDGVANLAEADTVRLRAGFQTGKVWNLQGLIEFEGIAHLNEDFNDTINGKAAYAVVADPKDAQLNRLQIAYSGLPKTVVTIGRQRINLDNQRFVGAVAFRQNEQTFDAVRLTNNGLPGLTLNYVFLNRVNRVFGEDSNQGAFSGPTHLANASYDFAGWGKLTGYAYFLDFDSAPGLSTRTFGARFAGQHGLGRAVDAVYALEYATQSDFAGNPDSYNLDYWLVEGGITSAGFKALGGAESLAGDGVRGFSTPLATLHKFQGYADVFLTTPANGIVDRYGTLSYEAKIDDFAAVTGLMAAATYHDFEAQRGGASFGSEFDGELVARMGKHWSTGVKYAAYNGDSGFADRNKLWFTIEVTY